MALRARRRTGKPPPRCPRPADPAPLSASPYIHGVASWARLLSSPPRRPRQAGGTPTAAGGAPTSDRFNLDFFCAAVIVGLLAGVAGLATTAVLRFVEHATYHYSLGTLLAGITGSSPVRRALGPVVGGALAGLGWWILRRSTRVPPLAQTIARHDRIPRLAWSIDAGLQVLLVGSGASLGREGAPRQFAAALGDFATAWLKRLSTRDREILLACAAGAGLGAVYAVPLAGALFSVRIMLNTWHPRALGAACLTSSLAVAVGSAVTHDQPSLEWPSAESTYLLT